MGLDELATFIHQQRVDQKLSRQELASRVGVSVNTLCRVEHGKNVSLEHVNDILRALGYRLNVVNI